MGRTTPNPSSMPSSSRPPPPLPQAQGDTALCPCPPRCWGTCKRCRKERCDKPADHEESCWCGCDRPTPPPTPPSDSRLPPSSPHVQRERPHDRVMKKWRALDKWASLVSKYWRALWASQALDLPPRHLPPAAHGLPSPESLPPIPLVALVGSHGSAAADASPDTPGDGEGERVVCHMSVATRADVQDVVTRVKQTLMAELRGGKTPVECRVRLAPEKPPPEQPFWQSGTRKA